LAIRICPAPSASQLPPLSIPGEVGGYFRSYSPATLNRTRWPLWTVGRTCGLPDQRPLAKIKKEFTKTDSLILSKWQANLLLQRAVYPVQVATFADSVDRHEELGPQEEGRMVARQSETFYEGLKETIERTENMVREVISQIERISSGIAG